MLPFDEKTGRCCEDLSGKTELLVAEDDQDLAQDLKETLEGLDYTVLEVARSAEQTVVLAEKHRPDLVLMDIQLSGEMDGIQAAEQLRAFQIPVIYVTGYCDGSVLERAQQTEPCGYILKPYKTSDIKIAVRMGLYRHQAEQSRQQLLKRFQGVLSSVKTLTGRLSICCYCKKIKDRAGDWPEVETYIMQHTNASFTHGMCPDCFASVKRKLEAIEENNAAEGPLVLG
ncbi:MAG TPA: response regulator [Verrucomicrobiae bacterium]|nr:response regulator [Verrucomicrobiae bacterium]